MAFLYCHLENRRQFKVREEENERDGSFYVWAHVPVARKKGPLTFVRKDTVETPSHLSCYTQAWLKIEEEMGGRDKRRDLK